jgi:hypothetical protein
MMATMSVLFRYGRVLTGLILLTTVTGCAALFGAPSQIPSALKPPSTDTVVAKPGFR